jgi:carboxymethylenebutenolidase
MDRAKIEQDFLEAARFLKAHEAGNGKLGAVGFCFGGYIVNMLAAVMPDALDAGVPFYGTPAAEALWGNIQGPLMIQLAELDQRVNAAYPPYESALEAAGVPFTVHRYAGANHGFHNDSTGRFDPDAADLAWERTLEFFREHLGAAG